MKKPCTDRNILKCIFEMYETSYPGPKTPAGRPENDPYIAIDISAIAEKLNQSPELLFGRLYYDLDYKHRYKQDNGALVSLFHLKVGDKRHAVHFPYLTAILARHNEEHRSQLWSVVLSVIALVLSLVSIAIQLSSD